ncbi:NAD-dependent epimerase/dehydratase family protein, partial [Streptomyces carpinensis]
MSSSSCGTPGTVLVSGGSGFVGRAVVEELAGRGGVPAVRVLARHAPASAGGSAVRHACADLTRPETLRG